MRYKGISIIELLTASIISVLIIGSVNVYLMQGYRTNEQIFLQAQVHAALSIISREIESSVKNGASVATNGNSELQVFDPDGNLIVTYRLENNNMRKYNPGDMTGTDLVKFADVIVGGDFALGLVGLFTLPDNTSATFNLTVTLNGKNSSYSVTTQPFNSKCRNRIRA